MMKIGISRGYGPSSGKSHTHSYPIPQSANSYEYYIVTFEARHYGNHLSWKLRDESGCEHDLPYFFRKGQLDTITIIVTSSSSGSYGYDCDLRCWPKELSVPIPKYYSITSIDLKTLEKYIEPPFGRSKRKGAKTWTIGSIVTFDSCHEIIECQQYSRIKHKSLESDIIIESPIIEVKCMWQNFNIEKESSIDLEEMIVRKQFAVSVNKTSAYNTNYRSTIRMLEPIDHEEYNKEISIPLTNPNHPLVIGARYEFKMSIDRLNVSYLRMIQVPSMSINQILWEKLFGSADQVTFLNKKAEQRTHWTDWYAGDGYDYDVNIELRYLTLYKHGAFYFKLTLQAEENAKIEEKLTYGGTFTLYQSANDSPNVKIDLLKLFKNKTEARPLIASSNNESFQLQPEAPAALQLPELVHLILSYFIEKERWRYRLVCKAWSHFMQLPRLTGTLTEDLLRVSGYQDFTRQKI